MKSTTLNSLFLLALFSLYLSVSLSFVTASKETSKLKKAHGEEKINSQAIPQSSVSSQKFLEKESASPGILEESQKQAPSIHKDAKTKKEVFLDGTETCEPLSNTEKLDNLNSALDNFDLYQSKVEALQSQLNEHYKRNNINTDQAWVISQVLKSNGVPIVFLCFVIMLLMIILVIKILTETKTNNKEKDSLSTFSKKSKNKSRLENNKDGMIFITDKDFSSSKEDSLKLQLKGRGTKTPHMASNDNAEDCKNNGPKFDFTFGGTESKNFIFGKGMNLNDTVDYEEREEYSKIINSLGKAVQL